MNEFTQKYLETYDGLIGYYHENKTEVDNVKCFSAMLPLLAEMLDTCRQEFDDSIAYMKEFHKRKEWKIQEIAIISNRIKMAIQDFYADKGLSKDLRLKELLEENLLNDSDVQMLDYFYRVHEAVQTLKDDLSPYGITYSLLHDFEYMILDAVQAMPFNVEEIETHKKRYYTALNAIKEIEMYLEFK